MNTHYDFFKDFFTTDFVSEYNHSNYIDNIDGKKFFHMDCSGFVNWCMAQMGYKRALVELRKFLQQHDFIKINRFYCRDFTFIHEHKNEFKHWHFTDTPTHGCILVVVFPDGNGHCMFVDKIIKNNKDKIQLRIIDSTRYPHKNDTRANGQTGIGIGDIEITYDNNGWLYDSQNPALPIRTADIYFVSATK